MHALSSKWQRFRCQKALLLSHTLPFFCTRDLASTVLTQASFVDLYPYGPHPRQRARSQGLTEDSAELSIICWPLIILEALMTCSVTVAQVCPKVMLVHLTHPLGDEAQAVLAE